MEKIGIQDLLETLFKVPQTQKDIRTIASTAEQVQSPQVQKQLVDLQSEISALSKTVLVLQGISAVAVVGMFLLQLKESRRR